MLGTFLADFFDTVRDQTLRSLVALANDVMTTVGPRPVGWTQGDVLDQLAAYLDVRDRPERWAQLLAEYEGQLGSRAAAEVALVNAATHYERLLDRRGVDGVRAALLLRRLGRAEPALREARRIADLPKIVVADAVPELDDVALLAGALAGDADEGGA